MEFTESFRHLSYLPQPEKRLFSLSDLLHNLEELLQTNFQENNISFTLRCSPEPMMTEGDEKQLSQVFLNHHRQWSRYSSRNYGQSIHPLFYD